MKHALSRRLAPFVAALTLLAAVPHASAAQFADVPRTYWASEEIDFVTSKGLFNGTTATTFSPEAPMKRGQLAAVLYRYAGSPIVSGYSYEDVSVTSYYAAGCLWAKQNGIFSQEKLSASLLRPDEAISRSEFAVMLCSFAKQNEAGAFQPVTQNPYTDMQSVSQEIKDAMLGWAVPNNIMNGTSSTTMNPFGSIKRSHVAAMLYRYEQLAQPQKPTEPPAPANPDKIYGPNEHIPLVGGHYRAQIAVGEKIYAGSMRLGCDDELMVKKVMEVEGLCAVAVAAGRTTLVVPTEENPRWITVDLTITETPAPPGEGVVPENPSIDREEFQAVRDEVIRLTNEERIKAGLAPLAVDQELMDAAQLRAVETLSKFSHTRPNGESCFTVSSKAFGENIARFGDSGAEFVQRWMDSQGHRENILRPSFSIIGVGFVRIPGSKTTTCVQLFG